MAFKFRCQEEFLKPGPSHHRNVTNNFVAVSNKLCFYNILLLNARSLVNKWNDFVYLVYHKNPDIICVTESWGHSDFLFAISGYNVFQKDRTQRHGGGVCIFIRDNIPARPEVTLNSHSFEEATWTVLKVNNFSIVLGCIYRPPNSSLINDQFLLDMIKSAFTLKTDCTIIVGDFSKLIVKVREAVNLTVGYENDDFTRNMVTIIAEARLVQYIRNNDVNAFVEADLATAIAALEA